MAQQSSAPTDKLKHLEIQLTELQKSLTSLAQVGDTSNSGLFSIIHKPGWTTIAEIEFATGMVDAMLSQARGLQASRQALLNGSQAVQ